MKEGFEPILFKNYNLTLVEQLKLDKFLKENLDKGYIWPSESPMPSPFFLFQRKMGNFDHAKIIDTLMIEWSKTLILYH